MKAISSGLRVLKFVMRVSLVHIAIISFTISLATAGKLTGQEILDKKISLNISNRMDKVLKAIERHSDVKFVYMSGVFDQNEQIDLAIRDRRLVEVFEILFQERNISFEIDGDYIILKRKDDSIRTDDELSRIDVADPLNLEKIRGQVLDENGQGIPGATILIKESSTGTTSDIEGNFEIEASSDHVLIISFIGYTTQEIEIGSKTRLEVQLEPDVIALDELIVVGYGTQKKSDVIGSISTVKGDQINLKSVSNVDAGLQGLAAGVSVLSQSGKPGAATSIKIRGANSIQSSTEPLWVIDGMPVYSDPNGLGESGQNPMSLVNSNDIESIQILKDAAATSIYGSRGSNGVIIVTTKTGKKGQSYTDLSLTAGISEPTRFPKDVGYANSSEWFEVMDRATNYRTQGRNTSYNINDTYVRLPGSEADQNIGRDVVNVLNINTDWYDEAFRTASFQELNVSSARGFDKGSFYFSGNYRTDKGVVDHNQLDRLALRSNLSFVPVSNFTLDAKLSFSYTDNEKRDDDLTTITKFSLPWMPVYDPDAPANYWNPYIEGNLVANNDPSNRLNNVKQYRGLMNLGLRYDVPGISGLFIRAELSNDYIQSNMVRWISGNINQDGVGAATTEGLEEVVTFNSVNYNIYPTYNQTFGKHTVGLTVGAEAQRRKQYKRRVKGNDLTGTYQELGVPGNIIEALAGIENERYLLGFFGRASYNYDNRYILGFSARRDGSSIFTANNRWGNFFAFSGGWVISEESFMSFLGGGTYLKVRGSFGETGNQNIENNQFGINYFQQVIYGSKTNGTVPTSLLSDDVTWETTKSLDFGLDFGFFQDRINGSVGYYRKFVTDMLLEKQLPASTGLSPDLLKNPDGMEFLSAIAPEVVNVINVNAGDMLNSGYELELTTVNVDSKLKWRTSLNFAINQNEIKRLSPELERVGLTTEYTISNVGARRGVWYLADYAGINPDNGAPQIYALDTLHFNATGETIRLKDGSGQDVLLYATDQNVRSNRFVLGSKSSDPTYYGGITNKFEYKGFDLSFFFSISGGNYLLDYDRQTAAIPNPTRNVLSDVLYHSWSNPGDAAKYPVLTRNGEIFIDGQAVSGFTDENVYHNRELYAADFVRLRNVTLGFNFPAAMLKKAKLASARIYFSANNLWTYTTYPGFDPEGTLDKNTKAHIYQWNTPIPQLRSFILGVNIKI